MKKRVNLKKHNTPAIYSNVMKHAIIMAGRNIRSYILLSVTIILSFSFLLGFFVLSDSNLYNDNKLTFAVDETVVMVESPFSGYDDINQKTNKFNILIYHAEQMLNTTFYRYFEKDMDMVFYDSGTDTLNATFAYVPNDFTEFFVHGTGVPERLDIISGESGFTADNQVIIDETLSELLGENETLKLPHANENGTMELKEYNVTGVMKAETRDKTAGETHVRVLLPVSEASDYSTNLMLILTKNGTDDIIRLCTDLNLIYIASNELHNSVLSEMRSQVMIKGMLAGILFLLLGINLYSSFKNALSDRKFEIGVKRAIGAKKRNIVSQFFYEGMVVMLINIGVSILFVLTVSSAFKIIQRLIYGNIWTVYISPYSAAIFILSAFFLSVSFSLIFAYQSTHVEIAAQLKSE